MEQDISIESEQGLGKGKLASITTIICFFLGGVFVVINALFQDPNISAQIKIFIGVLLIIISIIIVFFLLALIFDWRYKHAMWKLGYQIRREVRKLPCVVIDFQTFVCEFEDILLGGNLPHLYQLVCTTCGKFEDENHRLNKFKNYSKGYRDNYRQYRKEITDLNPKKVKYKIIKKYIDDLNDKISSSNAIFTDFIDYYKELKKRKPEACKNIEDNYKKFLEEYMWLQKKSVFLLEQLKKINMEITFISFPDAPSIEESENDNAE